MRGFEPLSWVGFLFKKMNSKHLRGKNFFINAVIAIIPASLVIGLIKETLVEFNLIVGAFWTSILYTGIIFFLIYFSGVIREKL